MNYTRSIKRNILKKKNGNNKIKNSWRNIEIKKIGIVSYIVRLQRTTKKGGDIVVNI